LLHPERKKILLLSEVLIKKMRMAELNIGQSSTHIIPIILGEECLAIQAHEELKKKRILTSMIRPPSVPPQTSRLRISLCNYHHEQDINCLMDTIKKGFLN
jgi:8-amino-7-oxononanoate synthase